MANGVGHHHPFTLPIRRIQPRLVEQQKKHAVKVLSPQFAEPAQATETPFVQAITDVHSPRAKFMDGKLLLVGDAVSSFRPHTTASTDQAVYHALSLEKVFGGEMEMKDAQDAIMQYARHMGDAGKRMGNRSQFRDSGKQAGQFGVSTSPGMRKDTE